jgi:hypothetical protein
MYVFHSRMRHGKSREAALHVRLLCKQAMDVRYNVGCSFLPHGPPLESWQIGAAQTTSPHPGTATNVRLRPLRLHPTLSYRPPSSSPVSVHIHTHGYTHPLQNSQWSTKSSSGAASVMPSIAPHTARASANDGPPLQALLHDYGSLALRCARSSTRNRSGSTPSTLELVAALVTGSWAWSTANSDSSPTDETNCSRSGHEGRSAKRLLLPRSISCIPFEHVERLAGTRGVGNMTWRLAQGVELQTQDAICMHLAASSGLKAELDGEAENMGVGKAETKAH